MRSPIRRLTRAVALLALPAATALAACSPFASPAVVTTPRSAGTGSAQSGEGPSSSVRTPAAKPPVVPADKRWHPDAMQHGLQIYAHRANGKAADANIAHILDYVVRLGANSVSYSFPIYTNGQHPTRVYAGKETPTPAVMANLVRAAHDRGLRVALRPLVDEANLRTPAGGWRGTIRPPDLSAWFRSYEAAVTPYLEVARTAHADEFVLASELTSLQPQHERWRSLAERAAKVFPGTMSYTFNFDSHDTSMVLPNGSTGLDLYFAVDAGPDASVEQLARSLAAQIMAKPKALRNSMVAQEVGIAAQDGSYRHPWNWGNPQATQLDPEIQVNWFTAACQAVNQTKLDGIYYWMLDTSVDPTQVNPSTEGPTGFIGRPGEKAIERCFSGNAR